MHYRIVYGVSLWLFLKFPPIVQSGSILFRKLDRERAEKRADPSPRLSPIGLGAHVWPMTSLSCRRVAENSATF